MPFCIILSAICYKAIELTKSLIVSMSHKGQVSFKIDLAILQFHFSSSCQIWYSFRFLNFLNFDICFVLLSKLVNVYLSTKKFLNPSSRGLAVMHLTQTNVVLGSRPIAGHW